jgi:S-adenosylmethionine:tRNA ribosyltransferase-isomerase
MRVDAFDFELPPECVALRPANPRDAARMLVVRPDGTFEHATVRDLPRYLRDGDAVVFNDTKVFRARLRGRRVGRGFSEPKIEAMLHKRIASDTFRAFVRPARKLDPGDRLLLGETLSATLVSKGSGGDTELRFDLGGTVLDEALATQGELPLPPYIAGKRKPDEQDDVDYQTVFAREAKSVAAPTAGLHFTERTLSSLADAGAELAHVTLHVGAGTFLPVSARDTSGHKMHAEYASLDRSTAERLNLTHERSRSVVAVGTTTVRTIESATTESGRIEPFSGETDVFITPGYRFRGVDVMLTNFHLPRSTLFMLVCAFSGLEVMRAAYVEAIAENYRFYSYGDACLLFRATNQSPTEVLD